MEINDPVAEVAVSYEELVHMRVCARIIDVWRPLIRFLLVQLPFKIYVYGGEAYQMYWESNARSSDGDPIFRRPMDVDSVVLSTVNDWCGKGITQESQHLTMSLKHLLRTDKRAQALQFSALKILCTQGIWPMTFPVFSTRSSPQYYKSHQTTGAVVIDHVKMYHTVTMGINILVNGGQYFISLLELHVQPRCSWSTNTGFLSKVMLDKGMRVTQILDANTSTSTTSRASLTANVSDDNCLWVPNRANMLQRADKVTGKRRACQLSKARTDNQRRHWFEKTFPVITS